MTSPLSFLPVPSWYREAIARVEAFASLKEGWDEAAAQVPNLEARANAARVLDGLRGIDVGSVRVHAAIDGGVVIVASRNARRVSFLADNEGEIVIGGSDGAGHPWSGVHKGDDDGVVSAVDRARQFLAA